MANSVEKLAVIPPTKKELIIDAARTLFLKLGFGATSMDAIAAEAGVSKRTVYSHFQNKEALFAGIVISMCQELGGPPSDPPPFGPPEEVLSA
ncbi:MAG: helix-turn-helix transcriptional regulator, partial [Proteobacteria bacterium]|nr:helix-turn-helix transcriptional regulator [Pseudomonadota bacterium]